MHENRMKVHRIRTPLSEEIARKFRVMDIVYLTGTIVTARDAAHIRALDYYKEGKPLPISLDGLAIFHCGPIVKKEKNGWRVVAAGPTTSARMEPFEDEFIKNFRVRIVIGKGGMGKNTVGAMKQFGAAYAAFTGGAGVLAAKAVKKVEGVEWSDLGMPEAMWILQVEDFGPLTIAIDAHGNNLYETIQTKAESLKHEIFRKLSKN
jgi:fumarate hydratase subunit beta